MREKFLIISWPYVCITPPFQQVLLVYVEGNLARLCPPTIIKTNRNRLVDATGRVCMLIWEIFNLKEAVCNDCGEECEQSVPVM